MLMAENPENNTIYGVPGRHGSQSFARFVNSRSDFKSLGKISESEVMSDHFKGKFRVIARDPMKKFQSSLSWYIDFLTSEFKPKCWQDCDYYDTISMILKVAMRSGSTLSIFENDRNAWRKTRDLVNHINVDIRDHFKYHLGESHLCFANLNLVLLVALGMDIDVFDVTDIDQIYKEFGFVDRNLNDQGKYVQPELKKQYYSDIVEIYMDTLETLRQDSWINHFYNPNKKEFNDIMAMEIRAYNALMSDHMVEDCRSFVLDLIRGILDPNSKIEKSYIMQTMGDPLIVYVMEQIPYQSDLYPAVGLISKISNRFVSGTWHDYYQDCKDLL